VTLLKFWALQAGRYPKINDYPVQCSKEQKGCGLGERENIMHGRSSYSVPSAKPFFLFAYESTYSLVLLAVIVLVCFCIPAASQQVPRSRHIVLVIEENTGFATTKAQMPWLVGQGNANGFANNFTTNSGGSLLDYLWLSSGSCHTSDATCAPSTRPAGTLDFGCSGGGCSSPITDDSIFSELDRAGISWKLYAESLPNPGYMGGDVGEYAERHNPAKWYSVVINSAAEQQKMVPFTQFAADISAGQLPAYSIIVPNLLNDAHDGSPAQADSWLQSNVAPVLNQPFFQPGGDGLLIITFDNGDGDVPGQVYTALIGPRVIPQTVSNTHYMHENTLRTILDSLGVTVFPGASASAIDMSDFFSQTQGGGGVTISTPAAGTQVNSPFQFSASAKSNTGLPITAMNVYIGNNLQTQFQGNGTSTLSASAQYSLAAGTYTITVNAWDSGGTLYQSKVTFSVSSSGPRLTITSPAPGAQVNSPVPFRAQVSSEGLAITAMKVYLGTTLIASYSGNGTSTLTVNDSYNIGSGAQKLTANAWDTAGTLYQGVVNFTVNPVPGVAISTPLQGAQASSPVVFYATATSNGAPITAMKVYINGNPNPVSTFNGDGTSSSLTGSAQYTLAPGTYTITANAWDTSPNTVYQSKVTFTVQ
jgi:hypothetical protein